MKGKMIGQTSNKYLNLVGVTVAGRVVTSVAASLPHANALGGFYSARLLQQAGKIKKGKM